MNQTSDPTDLARFDVREIPCRVKHAQILQRWFDLPIGQHFILINDHDPVPLYYQFAATFPDAFTWEYLQRGPDEFQVRITRVAESTSTGAAGSIPLPTACGGVVSPGDVAEIDARGLEPPEPLLRILNALEGLPHGSRLRAITDRKPCHLFGEAAARGFRHESHEQPNGSWITVLQRA